MKETRPRKETRPSPPIAAVRPHQVVSRHGTRIDNYHWLRDDSRADAQVLAHLRAETAYAEAMLAPAKTLEDTLYHEILARIAQDDVTVPVLDHGAWYYQRFETGKEYPIFARKKERLSADEEILLDGNEEARGHDYYHVGSAAISPDGTLLAYSEDTVGRRMYSLRIKNVATGVTLPDVIHNTSGAVEWANDNRTILYVEKHPTTLLAYRVRKHVLATNPADDPLVYEEKDETFHIFVDKSKSKKYIYIIVHSTLSTEVRYADADDPDTPFHVFLPREKEHEYSIDHVDDRFIVLTNWEAKNFRLMEVEIGKSRDKKNWREIVAHRDDVLLHDFEVFRRFVVISERSGGLRKLCVRRFSGRGQFYIDAAEPAYAAFLSPTRDIDSDTVRYVYTSLTTPPTTYDFDMGTGEKTLLKREPVLGDFNPDLYATEYIHAPSRDGTAIPVSVVYRKGVLERGGAPLYLYGYGAYGITIDPGFASTRLSLLDRGVVFAIAHVRGGEDLGRPWYEAGRLLHKKNTFYDFIDVTEFLVARGYAAADKIFAVGGSAGGLLVGAVANMRPDLYRGIIADVPFVDIVTSMLDDDIPLTTGEFDEWGDPDDRAYYEYMLSYSPYDNVAAQEYPAFYVTTGLWDSQVQYFEPAKWVAKLRAQKTDQNPVLLYVNLDAGHSGKSGRYKRYREVAREYAFFLHTLTQPDRRTGRDGR